MVEELELEDVEGDWKHLSNGKGIEMDGRRCQMDGAASSASGESKHLKRSSSIRVWCKIALEIHKDQCEPIQVVGPPWKEREGMVVQWLCQENIHNKVVDWEGHQVSVYQKHD